MAELLQPWSSCPGPYHLPVVVADGLGRPAEAVLVSELSPFWVLGVTAGHILQDHEALGEGVRHQTAPRHRALFLR